MILLEKIREDVESKLPLVSPKSVRGGRPRKKNVGLQGKGFESVVPKWEIFRCGRFEMVRH